MIQLDSDEDGYGNACDYDYNNDGGVGFDDFSLLLNSVSELAVGPLEQLDADSDGGVGMDDVSGYLWYVGASPGPSGLACSVGNQKFTCPPVISW